MSIADFGFEVVSEIHNEIPNVKVPIFYFTVTWVPDELVGTGDWEASATLAWLNVTDAVPGPTASNCKLARTPLTDRRR